MIAVSLGVLVIAAKDSGNSGAGDIDRNSRMQVG